MKKLVRTIAMILLGTALFTTTAFAAEVDTPTEQIQSLETQTIMDYIVETIKRPSPKGEIVVVVKCDYTGQWEEGYYGWINNASFQISYATVGGTKYAAEPVDHLWTSGSSAYQKYTVNGVSFTMSVTMDEWGDASLGMVVN